MSKLRLTLAAVALLALLGAMMGHLSSAADASCKAKGDPPGGNCYRE